MRSQIIGYGASEFDAQRTFLNTFKNMVDRRVDIPEDKKGSKMLCNMLE